MDFYYFFVWPLLSRPPKGPAVRKCLSFLDSLGMEQNTFITSDHCFSLIRPPDAARQWAGSLGFHSIDKIQINFRGKKLCNVSLCQCGASFGKNSNPIRKCVDEFSSFHNANDVVAPLQSGESGIYRVAEVEVFFRAKN